jgi:hypothetical protein
MQSQQRKIRIRYVYQIRASFDERALQDSRQYSLAVREKRQYDGTVFRLILLRLGFLFQISNFLQTIGENVKFSRRKG